MFCLGQALKSQCILSQNFLFLTIEGGPTIKPLLLPRSPKYVILRLIRLRCYDERLCVRSATLFEGASKLAFNRCTARLSCHQLLDGWMKNSKHRDCFDLEVFHRLNPCRAIGKCFLQRI